MWHLRSMLFYCSKASFQNYACNKLGSLLCISQLTANDVVRSWTTAQIYRTKYQQHICTTKSTQHVQKLTKGKTSGVARVESSYIWNNVANVGELQNTSYQMWTLIQNKINQLVSQTWRCSCWAKTFVFKTFITVLMPRFKSFYRCGEFYFKLFTTRPLHFIHRSEFYYIKTAADIKQD